VIETDVELHSKECKKLYSFSLFLSIITCKFLKITV
jgi:hypothetical protein